MRQKRRLLPSSVTAAARILNHCNHRNTNEQNRSTSIHINLITMHPTAFMHPACASLSGAVGMQQYEPQRKSRNTSPRTPRLNAIAKTKPKQPDSPSSDRSSVATPTGGAPSPYVAGSISAHLFSAVGRGPEEKGLRRTSRPKQRKPGPQHLQHPALMKERIRTVFRPIFRQHSPTLLGFP